MDTPFKFKVEAERAGSHVLMHWDNPIVGFGSFDICTETGMVFCDDVGEQLAYKIINDWLRPLSKSTANQWCHERVEYNCTLDDGCSNGIVVTYVFKDEDTGEYDSNRIVIVSKNEETIIYQGVFKHTMPNIYQARRYVKDYLNCAGFTVLQW